METNKVWKRLIKELVDKDIEFSLVNNVLSCKELGEDVRGLWLWFNQIRIAEEGDKKAGEMLIMDNYEIVEKIGKKALILYAK